MLNACTVVFHLYLCSLVVNYTKGKVQEPGDHGRFIIDEVGTVFAEQIKLYSHQLCYFACKKDDLTLENNIPK